MIVALPFCHKDEHLALLNLELALKLDGGPVPFDCVLCVDSKTEPSTVQAQAEKYFRAVKVCRYGVWTGNQNWPAPHNHAWQSTARYMDSANPKEPWLWWEADAVPLQKGWLSTLQTAYEQGKKPFAGHWVTGNKGQSYMNGVGIYPPQVNRYDTACYLCHQASFDIVLGPRLVTNCHRINHLIAHSLDPATFSTVPEIWEMAGKDAVLFHNCKDESIANLLLRKPFSRVIDAISNLVSKAQDVLLVESPVTVVITNWKRPDKVKTAFQSCLDAGVKNIVISSSACDSTLASVHAGFKMTKSDVVIDAIDEDRGCNEMWLRGVRLAKTPWVHILHDDDKLLRAFGKITPQDDVGFYHWNGAKHWCQTDTSKYPTLTGQIYDTFPNKTSGVYPTDALWRFLLNPHGLTLSPVAGLFRKEHLLETLEECDSALVSERFYYRPTLMVGNDLLIWLRAVEKYKTFYFYHEPKISYGHWDGSCSFEDSQRNGHAKLRGIYNSVRDYFYRGPELPQDPPTLIHLQSVYPATAREAEAQLAWWRQYQQGKWISRMVVDSSLPRLFNDGKRHVPYLKDLVSEAWKSEGQVCVLTNLDVFPVPSATRHIVEAVMKHGACYSYRRDMPALKPMDELQIRIDTNVYAGMDLFAFTRAWWNDHGKDFPDLLYATETWDYCLKTLMDSTGAKRFYYLIYHIAHQPECLRNKDSLSQKYNRKLAAAFLKGFNIAPYWETGIPIENPR